MAATRPWRVPRSLPPPLPRHLSLDPTKRRHERIVSRRYSFLGAAKCDAKPVPLIHARHELTPQLHHLGLGCFRTASRRVSLCRHLARLVAQRRHERFVVALAHRCELVTDVLHVGTQLRVLLTEGVGIAECGLERCLSYALPITPSQRSEGKNRRRDSR